LGPKEVMAKADELKALRDKNKSGNGLSPLQLYNKALRIYNRTAINFAGRKRERKNIMKF
jgi:hypothetical protein